MPEIIEVFLTTKYLNYKLQNKFIDKFSIKGGRYLKEDIEKINEFKKALPLKINNIKSKGKFMWFELSNDFYILNTYGMSGRWGFYKEKHSDISFKISDATILYFTDPRHFGTISFSNGDELDHKLAKLAPDFIQNHFTNNDLYHRIENLVNNNRGHHNIVRVLMDQTNKNGIGSGLGNYLVSEILFRAKISPHTTIDDLYDDKKMCNRLSKSIKYIIKLALLTENIGYLADLDDDFFDFINNFRKKIKNLYPEINIKKEIFKFNIYRQGKDPYGNNIVKEKLVPGRKFYWSPAVQS